MSANYRLTLHFAALAVAVLALCGIRADAAQPAKSKPAPELNDMRAVNATPADVADGKKLTESSCVRCHGTEGISTTKGVPHLAGQRPAYLYGKLRAYQTGARTDHSMEGAVKFLNDDALVKVAAYYASLEPASPAAELAKTAQSSLDPLAAAKSLAASCGGCHGESGVTKMPGTPSIIGFDPKYFTSAMNAYKSGQRKHDVMKALATPLSDQDLKNIGILYALQKPGRAQTAVTGNAAAGKAAAAACSGCHGENGVSTNPANPSLAGQDAQYFVAALKAYKDGTRKEETMKLAVSSLTDKAIVDMAAFYAQQEPRAPKVEKPLTLAQWVQRCDRCHGVNGNSTDPRAPALAAQRIDYLQKALRAYQGGHRKSSAMAAMAGTLSESDVDSLASYYARQKARALVFVTIPAK
ncbi:MAG: c-type cytochrome [Burkholderiales bacterium]